jgi:hypothetical protein
MLLAQRGTGKMIRASMRGRMLVGYLGWRVEDLEF